MGDESSQFTSFIAKLNAAKEIVTNKATRYFDYWNFEVNTYRADL